MSRRNRNNSAAAVQQPIVEEQVSEQPAANDTVEEQTVEASVAEVKFPSTAEMEAMGLATKSARIRHLASLGMKKGDIARQETNGLYQHVYNVLKRPLKRPAAAVATPAPAASESPAAETSEQVAETQTA